MSDSTGYWSRLALLSFTGIYTISLAWSLSPFVKLCSYPSICSNLSTKPDAEEAGDGPDTVCSPDTSSQTETSGLQEHHDDKSSAHHSHMRPEVRSLRNEHTAISDLHAEWSR
jgi:hypothetical protein